MANDLLAKSRVRPPPRQTVRAVFPHTAFRVGLVSSVSLPFASRLRFTLIPMDAPPYGRAVSDAPPHSGLSPIAVFRHYCSRHLICIVPFFTQRPFASTGIAPLRRYYGLVRLLLTLSRRRSPKFAIQLSRHAAPLCPAMLSAPQIESDASFRLHATGYAGRMGLGYRDLTARARLRCGLSVCRTGLRRLGRPS